MLVSVHDVFNDPSSTVFDERDGKYAAPHAIESRYRLLDSMYAGRRRG